jgi:hypothetical protein
MKPISRYCTVPYLIKRNPPPPHFDLAYLAEGLRLQHARHAEEECLTWAWNHAPTRPGRSGGGEAGRWTGSGYSTAWCRG